MPSAAVPSTVEFDAQLPPPGKAVGQGDEATFVNGEVGPVPLAAAHAATGLHMLLGVIAAGQDAVVHGDADTLAWAGGPVGGGPGSLQNAMSPDALIHT